MSKHALPEKQANPENHARAQIFDHFMPLALDVIESAKDMRESNRTLQEHSARTQRRWQAITASLVIVVALSNITFLVLAQGVGKSITRRLDALEAVVFHAQEHP